MARTLKEIKPHAAKIRAKYVGLNNIKKALSVNNPGEYDGIDEYRDFRKQCAPTNHVTIKNRSGKGRKLNKGTPWYYLTKKEHIAIENNRKSAKMTHQDYIEGYLKQKLSKWEMKHPKPKEDDLFYKEEYPKWVADREAQHDKIVQFLSHKYIKKYTRPLIYHILESKYKVSKMSYKKAA